MSNKYEFPTETIDLPSKGLLYPKDHPLRKGYTDIKYMTAREEDILASQALIRKGTVLDKLFESVIVEPLVNPNDVFIGDKNAILLATRVMGLGPDYSVEVTDPFTLEPQTVTLDLSKVKTKDFDESIVSPDNIYKFKTPKTGNELTFKLLTHGDEVEINKELQALTRLYKGKDVASFDVTTRFKHMIISVDGNSDRGFINKWVDNQFLALDTKEFRKYVRGISPDMDLTFEFKSDITGETEALDIPFGVSFFYPTR